MIMRYFLLIIISVLLSVNVKGQSKVNFYINDFCTNTIKPLDCVLQSPSGIKYSNRDSLQGCFILKEEGAYLMTSLYRRGDFMHYIDTLIEIKNNSVINDTILLGKFYECSEWSLNPTKGGFCYCDKLCNGELIDYYENGNKKIEGLFLNGIPKGKLIYYRSDG